MPAAYGPPTTVYNRFTRWSRRGEIALTVYASEPKQPNDPYGTGTESWTVRVIDPAGPWFKAEIARAKAQLAELELRVMVAADGIARYASGSVASSARRRRSAARVR